ncbi:MAG: hypothetical protein AAGF04_04865 [Chlamydiota bacterium]
MLPTHFPTQSDALARYAAFADISPYPSSSMHHSVQTSSWHLPDASLWEKLCTYGKFISVLSYRNAALSGIVIYALKNIFFNTFWIQKIGTLSFSSLPITLVAMSILGTAIGAFRIFFSIYLGRRFWNPIFQEKDKIFYTNTISGNILFYNSMNYRDWFVRCFNKPVAASEVFEVLEKNPVWFFLPCWDYVESAKWLDKPSLMADILTIYSVLVFRLDPNVEQFIRNNKVQALLEAHPNLKGPFLLLQKVREACAHREFNLDAVISEYKKTLVYKNHIRALLEIKKKYTHLT